MARSSESLSYVVSFAREITALHGLVGVSSRNLEKAQESRIQCPLVAFKGTLRTGYDWKPSEEIVAFCKDERLSTDGAGAQFIEYPLPRYCNEACIFQKMDPSWETFPVDEFQFGADPFEYADCSDSLFGHNRF